MHLNMEQFLRLLSNRYREPEQPLSCKPSHSVVTAAELESFSEQLRKIYLHIFNGDKNILQLQKVVPLSPKKTKVPICNKLLGVAQSVYRCYECFIHESAVLCEECFEKGNHTGHRFKKISSGGGNCDCGNPLALKKEGFCSNHTGTVEIPEIPEEAKNIFDYIIGNMLSWFFTLIKNREHFSEMYGLMLFRFLTTLNKQSIYYNVLTYHLISKKQKDSSYLALLFRLKSNSLPQTINELFFEMFTLDDFKLTLANEFLNAYNTVQGFEKTAFHSLYIQLFANDNVVLPLVYDYQNTFSPTKAKYDFERYMTDLLFIASIGEKPALAFYGLFLAKNKYVKLPFLDEIELELEKNGSMHEVDLVTRFLNTENCYYNLHSDMLGKVKGNKEIVVAICKGLYQALAEGKYSYRKNKAILPHHRIFALALFTLFRGQLEHMTLKNISKQIQVEEEALEKCLIQSCNHIFNCLLDFAETFTRRNYFDNYIVLYVKSGLVCIRYDYLFLKQAAYALKSTQLTKGLHSKFKSDADHLQSSKTKDPEKIIELLNKWISFCSLMIEIAATQTAEMTLDSQVEIQNKKLKQEREALFKQIIKKVGPITREQIASIEKYYTGSLEDKFLIESTDFDRNTKKYQAKASESQNIGEFLSELYMSKRKLGHTWLAQLDGKSFYSKTVQSVGKQSLDEARKIFDVMISHQLLADIGQFFVANAQVLDQKQRENLGLDFMSLIKKVNIFSSELEANMSLIDKVAKLLPNESLESQVVDRKTEELRQELLKKNQLSKKEKLLSKQNKALSKFSAQLQKLNMEENELVCILCRGNQTENEVLGYFSTLRYKKTVSTFVWKHSFIYDSCFHTAHYSCYKNLCKNKYSAQCPLCKISCNIMLPVDCESTPLEGFMDRMKIIVYQLWNSFAGPNRPHVTEGLLYMDYGQFQSMMESLVEQVGFAGVLNQAEFQRKSWRVCRELVKFMTVVWKSLEGGLKESLYQKMGKILQKCSGGSKTDPSPSIRHCVISTIFKHIQNNETQIGKIDLVYGQSINNQDLAMIKQNLHLILGGQVNEPMEIDSNQVERVKILYKFYRPPQTVTQLIKERDQKTAQNCKTGHNIFVCCECEKVVCADCQTISPHYLPHGSEGMYFSLLTGAITINCTRKINLPSLYENGLGVEWTSNKQPQGFTLNEELYRDLTLNLASHTIEDMLRKKFPKLISDGINNDMIIVDQDD